MKKLAVFFPGIGYTVDKPLMYYGRKLFTELGYETFLLPYTGFPKNVYGDREKIEASIEIALKQAREMLQIMAMEEYQEIVFVGKSVGTIVAATIAQSLTCKERIRFVFYTPLEESFDYPLKKVICFTGTADPWVGTENAKIPKLCMEKKITCEIYADANHSLETGDWDKDLEYLRDIMKKTKKFVE